MCWELQAEAMCPSTHIVRKLRWVCFLEITCGIRLIQWTMVTLMAVVVVMVNVTMSLCDGRALSALRATIAQDLVWAVCKRGWKAMDHAHRRSVHSSSMGRSGIVCSRVFCMAGSKSFRGCGAPTPNLTQRPTPKHNSNHTYNPNSNTYFYLNPTHTRLGKLAAAVAGIQGAGNANVAEVVALRTAHRLHHLGLELVGVRVVYRDSTTRRRSNGHLITLLMRMTVKSSSVFHPSSSF
jgi:hypothetical protein